jgi:branched-chain amino acid aminotransferase
MTTPTNFVITKQGVTSYEELPDTNLNFDNSVYEVIRIMDGVALFLEDHYARLQNSMNIKGVDFAMDYQQFQQKISELVNLNHKSEGNIKFVCSAAGSIWVFTFIPHSYPSESDYSKGIPVGLVRAERVNPNAKVISSNIREAANRMIENHKLYEVLLVDRDGMITEGSRSNVFFVRDHVFYTAPASKVLVGITRLKVLECLRNLNFKVVEQAIDSSEIDQFEAAFLTGTSPKVLPIRSVGEFRLDAQFPELIQLMDVYDRMILQYIQAQ